MKYLGIEPRRPRVAVFDFTGCEGCELQLVNKESSLADFLAAVEIAAWREASSSAPGEFDVALVEGAVSRSDEAVRLKEIRRKARTLVALGSCACFGGVNRLKNDYDLKEANRIVYGGKGKDTMAAEPVKVHVKVDLEIPGCPVSKDEVERIVQSLVWDVPFRFPAYPVCFECKQRFNVCVFDKGQLCLGPVTRAGCGAPCPAAGLGCWGCRGPTAEPNMKEFLRVAAERRFDERDVLERLRLFGGFEEMLPDRGKRS